jgi:hypothetical protein
MQFDDENEKCGRTLGKTRRRTEAGCSLVISAKFGKAILYNAAGILVGMRGHRA